MKIQLIVFLTCLMNLSLIGIAQSPESIKFSLEGTVFFGEREGLNLSTGGALAVRRHSIYAHFVAGQGTGFKSGYRFSFMKNSPKIDPFGFMEIAYLKSGIFNIYLSQFLGIGTKIKVKNRFAVFNNIGLGVDYRNRFSDIDPNFIISIGGSYGF